MWNLVSGLLEIAGQYNAIVVTYDILRAFLR